MPRFNGSVMVSQEIVNINTNKANNILIRVAHFILPDILMKLQLIIINSIILLITLLGTTTWCHKMVVLFLLHTEIMFLNMNIVDTVMKAISEKEASQVDHMILNVHCIQSIITPTLLWVLHRVATLECRILHHHHLFGQELPMIRQTITNLQYQNNLLLVYPSRKLLTSFHACVNVLKKSGYTPSDLTYLTRKFCFLFLFP